MLWFCLKEAFFLKVKWSSLFLRPLELRIKWFLEPLGLVRGNKTDKTPESSSFSRPGASFHFDLFDSGGASLVNERRAESLSEESREPGSMGWGAKNILCRKVRSGKGLGRMATTYSVHALFLQGDVDTPPSWACF